MSYEYPKGGGGVGFILFMLAIIAVMFLLLLGIGWVAQHIL